MYEESSQEDGRANGIFFLPTHCRRYRKFVPKENKILLSIINSASLNLLDWFIHRVYLKNGICIQKYHFWPKNDGEKWSRKIYFEIPPCGKIVIFYYWICYFGHFYEVRKNSLPHGGISKRFFSRPLFTIILGKKLYF